MPLARLISVTSPAPNGKSPPPGPVSVVSTGSETLAQEWISAFSQRDSLGNSMRVTPVIDLGNNVKLPLSLPSGQQGGQSGGASSQSSSKDAAGGSIPSVAQLLLGMPS